MSYHDQAFVFADRGLTLIEGKNLDEGGSNGSGKSSIWDGISWSLFGQTVRGLKADEVIHRAFKKDCIVSCEFENKGRTYSVNRSRKHTDSGDRFWIMEGSKKIEFGTVVQTQSWLEKELEVDFELFRCTVLFAQGETFNFVNETNKVQKDILSKVMRIDYTSYLERAKESLTEKRGIIEARQHNLSVLRSHLIEDVDEKFRIDIEDWETQRQTKVESLRSSLKRLEREKNGIEDAIKPVDKLIQVQRKLKEKIADQKTELANLNSDISKHSASLMFWEKRAKTIALGECSLCHQLVSEDHLCKEKDMSIKEVSSLSAVIKDLKSAKDSCQEKLDEYQEKAEKISGIIADQSGKLIFLRSIKSNIHSIERDIEEQEAEENPFLKKKDQEIEKQRKIVEKISESEAGIKAASEQIPYLEFWVNAFGDNGIKSFVFDLVCSTLTMKTNMYLNTLSGGSVSVSFDTQKKLKTGEYREKFDCVVMSNNERILYDAYSGGEKRRISLAVDMALSELMSDYHHTKFNMAVFDEQDSYLDDQGRRQFLNLLKDAAKDKNVFVVAHDDTFKNMFDTVLMIYKKNGISIVGELT